MNFKWVTLLFFLIPLSMQADPSASTLKVQPTAEKSESREVTIDPAHDTDAPGQKFNQSANGQFHNEIDEKLRLRNEANLRRLDRIGGNRE